MQILVQAFGRLGKLAMDFISKLAAKAAARGVVEKGFFVASALLGLSVGLQTGNGVLCRQSIAVLGRAGAFMEGMTVPT